MIENKHNKLRRNKDATVFYLWLVNEPDKLHVLEIGSNEFFKKSTSEDLTMSKLETRKVLKVIKGEENGREKVNLPSENSFQQENL